MLVKTTWFFLIPLIVSVFLHEIGHWISARLLHLSVISVHFGNGYPIYSKGKIVISCIPFSGYVEVGETELLHKKTKDIFIFFISGACTNLILEILLLPFWKNLGILIFLIENMLCIIVCLLPFLPETDMNIFIRVKRKKLASNNS